MEILKFKDTVFQRAVKEGIEQYEVFYSRNDNFGITVFKGEIDKYNLSSTMGVGFRAVVNGKMGYSYTERMDDEGAEFLVKNAMENAKNIDSDDKEWIGSVSESYAEIESFNEELGNIGAEEKIKLVLELEKEVRIARNKVVNIGYCGLGNSTEERGIFNSNGINITSKSNFIYAAVTPVVSDGSRVYNEMSYVMGNDIRKIEPQKLALQAVKEAESRIGGETVESGKYKVILRNDVSAELLRTFSGAFCADNAQKGLSLLRGREGEFIASDKITLLDNPLMEDGIASTPFDGEGSACLQKEVIREGKLITLLHNMKTAALDGVETTGNASRPSYTSPIGVAPTNFYFKPGNKDCRELFKQLGDGLFITDIAGTHAGGNSITGDFSLAAKGFLIEEGELGKPVEQITIAGNYYQLLKSVVEVGTDLEFILPSASGCYGSPALMLSEISVAGK